VSCIITKDRAMDLIVAIGKLPAERQAVFIEAIMSGKPEGEMLAFVEARLAAGSTQAC